MVVWQTYPMSTGDDFTAFNWDWLSDPDPVALAKASNSLRAVLSEAYIVPDP
jgi:hypothetical protein